MYAEYMKYGARRPRLQYPIGAGYIHNTFSRLITDMYTTLYFLSSQTTFLSPLHMSCLPYFCFFSCYTHILIFSGFSTVVSSRIFWTALFDKKLHKLEVAFIKSHFLKSETKSSVTVLANLFYVILKYTVMNRNQDKKVTWNIRKGGDSKLILVLTLIFWRNQKMLWCITTPCYCFAIFVMYVNMSALHVHCPLGYKVELFWTFERSRDPCPIHYSTCIVENGTIAIAQKYTDIQ